MNYTEILSIMADIPENTHSTHPIIISPRHKPVASTARLMAESLSGPVSPIHHSSPPTRLVEPCVRRNAALRFALLLGIVQCNIKWLSNVGENVRINNQDTELLNFNQCMRHVVARRHDALQHGEIDYDDL
jgi:hypothetical protein